MRVIILYTLGILLTVVGAFFIIINLNLLTIGYSFLKFLVFIISHFESLCFFIGLFLLIATYEIA